MKLRKFKRERKARRALLKSLFQALIEREKIITTEAKAKELRPLAEKLISKARNGTLAGRRELAKYLTEKNLNKLFKVLGPKYKERDGGYLRIIKTGLRKADSAKTAVIEFV